MITSSEEYMKRLDDIQNQTGNYELVMLPSDEPRFIIDANQRTITIPDSFTFLGVLNDHNAETVYFEIDRYYDQMDLSTQTCIIQFESVSSSGTKISEGFYPVSKLDVDTVPNKIIFGWEIQNDATAYAGNVFFSVRFYSTKKGEDGIVFAYNFNTTAVSLPVKDSLNTADKAVAVEPGETQTLTEYFVSLVKQAQAAAQEAQQTLAEIKKLTTSKSTT